jgi:DNA repair protein RecO (recombination protein O)
VLELTEKVVPEETPQPAIFQLLIDFLGELAERKKNYLTLVLAYEVRMLKILGVFPAMDACVSCERQEGLTAFSVAEGGMLCPGCEEKKTGDEQDALIYHVNFDIVEVINYFASKPLGAFRSLALEEKAAEQLQRILRAWFAYHLDVGDLKSEAVFAGGF